MKKLFMIFWILFSLISITALEPPDEGEIEKYKRDGTFQKRLSFAKELRNHKVSPELVCKLLNKINGKEEMAPPTGWRGMPTKGVVKIFALLISFSDYPFHNPPEIIDCRLFGDGTTQPPYESLRNFYRRSSYGQLEITGSTLGWYTTPYPRDQVSQTTQGRERLIKEALTYFEELGHDFSQYDNDGDGIIDYFVVIWTGPDNGWANFWWGYQTYFYDSSFKLDGKRLGSYSWQWESRRSDGAFSPKVVIHETGHALGLPDYYDYDDSIGPIGGVGGLDQMDGNWGDHNCFSKMLLEWIEPRIVKSSNYITLSQAGRDGDAVIVTPEFSFENQFSEFFIVQYRTRIENDVTYPNDGLLIWHVDARTDSLNYDFIYDNSFTEHKLLRLMEADGLEEIEQGRIADSGDYYTKGSLLTYETVPSNKRYCGINGGFEITDIGDSGETITFRIDTVEKNPQVSKITKLSNPFRLKLEGTNITTSTKVQIGSDTNLWDDVSFYENSLILGKGNKLKRKIPKKGYVNILLMNEDGGATIVKVTRK